MRISTPGMERNPISPCRAIRPFSIAILPLSFVFSCMLFFSCAKQGFPPGGPEDKKSPEIFSSRPAIGSVEVPLDAKIEIAFSERMEPRSVERSVFVSPNPEGALGFDWNGKSVGIKLPSGLQADRTYVVTVGTDARDEHRNRLLESYRFAFSTGAALARGEIRGGIRAERKVGPGVYVLAYDLNAVPEPDPVVHQANYITQTAEYGAFALTYLSSGAYRLFAFEDEDRNEKYTPSKDPLGICPGDVVLSDSAGVVQMGPLYLAVRDTTAPGILTVRASDRTHLTVRLSKEVEVASLAAQIDGLGIEAHYVLPESGESAYPTIASTLHLRTQPQHPGSEYPISLSGRDRWGHSITEETRITSFSGSAHPDTLGPRLVSYAPSGEAANLMSDFPVALVFDDAMGETMSDSALIWEAPLTSPVGTWQWSHANRVCFVPKAGWQTGTAYRLAVDPGRFFDRAGNASPDSAFAVSFRMLSADTLGVLSGDLSDEREGAGAFHLEAVKIGRTQERYETVVSEEGSYSWGLLPGSYTLSAYRDEDGNGRLSLGQVRPFVPAERMVSYADTLTIRSRWTTSEINWRFAK
ncbi:MAG: Ig-like domain-containing protein [Candidatus Latescibacterota bacterium]